MSSQTTIKKVKARQGFPSLLLAHEGYISLNASVINWVQNRRKKTLICFVTDFVLLSKIVTCHEGEVGEGGWICEMHLFMHLSVCSDQNIR